MSFEVNNNNNNRPQFPPPFGQQAPPLPGSRPGPPPPPGAIPRSQAPMPNRPSGPPSFGVRPPPPGTFPAVRPPPPGPHPGPFQSSPVSTGHILPPCNGAPTPLSNGPPAFASGSVQGGPRFSSAGSMPRPLPGNQPPPPMPAAQSMRSFLGSPPGGSSPVPAQVAPPFSAPVQGVPLPPSGSSPFLEPLQGLPPPSVSPFGSQPWGMQPRQVMFYIN